MGGAAWSTRCSSSPCSPCSSWWPPAQWAACTRCTWWPQQRGPPACSAPQCSPVWSCGRACWCPAHPALCRAGNLGTGSWWHGGWPRSASSRGRRTRTLISHRYHFVSEIHVGTKSKWKHCWPKKDETPASWLEFQDAHKQCNKRGGGGHKVHNDLDNKKFKWGQTKKYQTKWYANELQTNVWRE